MANPFAIKETGTTEPEQVDMLLLPDKPPPSLIALNISSCTLPAFDELQELDSLTTGAGTEIEEMG